MTLEIGIPLTLPLGFGLSVCMAEGKGFVAGIDPRGSVAQWNSAVAPEMQVDIGDRIDGFKVKGHGFKKLVYGNEFSLMKNRAVVLRFTKPSVYTVKGKGRYGIDQLRERNSDRPFFVVSKVHPVGSIRQWNEEFPDMQVSVGDVLREVNGVKGSACGVKRMLTMNPDEEKRILVFHYPDVV